MRIAINGFGRIGRTILRQILSQPEHADIEVVMVNDIAPLETCAYLFQYDSTFGPYKDLVQTDTDALIISNKRLPFVSSQNIASNNLSGVDVLFECTGKVQSRQDAERGLLAGAKRVLISGPSNHADLTANIGVNDTELGGAKIVSNASCTTNAIAPLLAAIDASLGIVRAHVTTIHCVTSSQPMVDSPRGSLERSRAGGESMVPTTTSAATELAKILPKLAQFTTISAVRVPGIGVSAIDATLQLKMPIQGSAIEFLKEIANRSNAIGSINDPCVSVDLRKRPESVIVALPQTLTVGNDQLRVFGWYDNEWGFSARMIDMAHALVVQTQKEES